ncbi:MAG: hypothetical protein KUG73_13580 [Pseudomonadales bacterium]|nr:hypothetical protein [Pseudomonadales bacterium]
MSKKLHLIANGALAEKGNRIVKIRQLNMIALLVPLALGIQTVLAAGTW